MNPRGEAWAWLVRAGREGETVEHNLQHNVATYAWDQLPDLRTYASKEELKDDIDALTPGFKGNTRTIGIHAAQLWRFRADIKPDDVVIMPLKRPGDNRHVAIGRVTGQYQFDASQGPGVHHRIPVAWLNDNVDVSDLDRDLRQKFRTFRRTVRQIGEANATERLLRIADAGSDAGRSEASKSVVPTYVLTWNPRPQTMDPAGLEDHQDYWLEKIRSTEGDSTSDGSWSTGSRKGGINKGDDLMLFLHGAEGGIIASGTAASEVYDNPADGTNWVDVEWKHWVAAEDCLPVAQLRDSIAPTFFEYTPRGSGRRLSDEEAISLKQAWQDLLEQSPSLSGDEAGVRVTGGETVPEGAVSRAEVNRYERSRWARAECLRHYGHECQVCGLDFEEHYGELGKGFMHVHHVTPMHEIAANPDYRLDPVDDLRPVCPNCHAMLHRHKDRTLTVEELRDIRASLI